MTSDFRGLPKCISAKCEILVPSILQASSPRGTGGAYCYPTTSAPHRACSQAMHHLAEFIQGFALAEPGFPWRPTFALGQLENLRFFIQIICWAPKFYRFRVLGSLQFSLEHSLVHT